MTAAKPRIRRCAVYARKSTEEGLGQDFNSLDAQREACEAYIKSQTGEGWKMIRSRYDDGGFSGGTMDRPALQRLLTDIRARRVDTVVVYKVDRLTRSLADFAKIVDVFDTHDVSFVSVTQQFNTTTSMGRLTLNMLLSFAQFEREVTGERIRDKIAASKKKGMWMGGFVPLGYEPDGRTLAINEAEAETVRTVFRLYLEHGNVRRVKEEADRFGLTTKVRQSGGGRMWGGRPLSRGYIYKLLDNPLYIGRIAHRGATYEGQHPPIIDPATWETVQAKLSANACARRSGNGAKQPSPLAGKLFGKAGGPLTPSHAIKSGRRYRYYVSRHLITGPDDRPESSHQEGWRLPAREIERVVAEAVTGLLSDRSALTDAARDAGMAAERIPGLLRAAANRKGEVLDLVERVEIAPARIVITLDLGRMMAVSGLMVRHEIPTRIKRRGVEMRLVIEGSGDQPAAPVDAALVKAVVRAHAWFDDLVAGRAKSLKAIGKAQNLSDQYVSRLMRLAFLAPEIVEAVLAGTQPVDLTAETLINHTDLPTFWVEQKAFLGFR